MLCLCPARTLSQVPLGWEEPNGWNLEGLGFESGPHHSLAGVLGGHVPLEASVSSPETMERMTPASWGGVGVTLSCPQGALTGSRAQSEHLLDRAVVTWGSQRHTSALCWRGLAGCPQACHRVYHSQADLALGAQGRCGQELWGHLDATPNSPGPHLGQGTCLSPCSVPHTCPP